MRRRIGSLATLVIALLVACGEANPTPVAVSRPSPTSLPIAPPPPTSTAAPSTTPTDAPSTTPTSAPSATPTSPPAALPVAQQIDVGGHTLFVDCQGTGRPVVLLDAGLGNDSTVWTQVQPEVAAFTAVCRYDRAGVGMSQPGPGPRTSAQIVAELHTLLERAAIDGPYVLVGASFGGLNMQLYASQYPQDVAGLVLVDATHADLDTRIAQLLSPQQARERLAGLTFNAERISVDDLLSSNEQVRAAGPLPDVPLIVLRHGQPFELAGDWPSDEVEQLWLELQTDLAGRTPQGKLIVAERSGHRIHQQQPELVVEAVREIVTEAGTR